MTKKKKILIIDDDRSLVEVLSQKLSAVGFDPVLAYNGQEGLEKVKTTKPDLILLDLIMPIMDGITMLKELRKTSDTPVIVLTNLSNEEKLSEALKSGSHDYLIKASYSLEEIINKINQVLKGE
ncbi:MAG: response regulator [Patescibacteria group bacterium]|jgi:DNA-binding response OmpR family regulator